MQGKTGLKEENRAGKLRKSFKGVHNMVKGNCDQRPRKAGKRKHSGCNV
jgi:hypothetical protein